MRRSNALNRKGTKTRGRETASPLNSSESDSADLNTYRMLSSSTKSALLSSNFSLFFDDFSRGKKSFGLPSEHRKVCRKLLDPKPAIGGVPCRGSGGSWGRNQRHGERQSRFRPQQQLSRREASFSSGQGVWGQHAPLSASSPHETKRANEFISPPFPKHS